MTNWKYVKIFNIEPFSNQLQGDHYWMIQKYMLTIFCWMNWSLIAYYHVCIYTWTFWKIIFAIAITHTDAPLRWLIFSPFFTVLQILRTVECLTKLFTFLFKHFLSLIVIIFQKFGYFWRPHRLLISELTKILKIGWI